ncbi:uncharacterized protein J4E78_007021 [Alternaria triticimaculans]|uniref:uncharacterized protein n=1 Tax=Alternaria triticimaculans TaxID=297637 RepID=UPI0020C29384|nr:uncharacterized protein J4E78_007021 [Alternaria triticimaculans]KAI4654844.1 hypothetical protein J4E78_007021 [Alternaria triticimaculans]
MPKIISLILAFALSPLLVACTQSVLSLDKTTPNQPTVGFALTVDHVVASVRWNNVSTEDLVELKASEDLKDLFDDWPRQEKRTTRKEKGLPASPEVAVIAKVLEEVVEVVKTYVDSPISALISFPALPGLYQEDIRDAADYVGLAKLGPWLEASHPHEDVAAYAGNGLGLCKEYHNEEKCREEGKNFTSRHTLLVEHTESALLLHHNILREPIETSYLYMDLATSFDLGSAHEPDELDIQDFVLSFLYHQYYYPTPHLPDSITVMMTGSPESLSDGKARRVTKRVIEALGAKAVMVEENPSFKAARGAAELAW